jgi:hypothetical protein
VAVGVVRVEASTQSLSEDHRMRHYPPPEKPRLFGFGPPKWEYVIRNDNLIKYSIQVLKTNLRIEEIITSE